MSAASLMALSILAALVVACGGQPPEPDGLYPALAPEPPASTPATGRPA
jgi:hypothetical protein